MVREPVGVVAAITPPRRERGRRAGHRRRRAARGAGQGILRAPTVFVVDDPHATVAQEEIFGPVLTIIPYDAEDDVDAYFDEVEAEEQNVPAEARRIAKLKNSPRKQMSGRVAVFNPVIGVESDFEEAAFLAPMETDL